MFTHWTRTANKIWPCLACQILFTCTVWKPRGKRPRILCTTFTQTSPKTRSLAATTRCRVGSRPGGRGYVDSLTCTIDVYDKSVTVFIEGEASNRPLFMQKSRRLRTWTATSQGPSCLCRCKLDRSARTPLILQCHLSASVSVCDLPTATLRRRHLRRVPGRTMTWTWTWTWTWTCRRKRRWVWNAQNFPSVPNCASGNVTGHVCFEVFWVCCLATDQLFLKRLDFSVTVGEKMFEQTKQSNGLVCLFIYLVIYLVIYCAQAKSCS